MENVNLASKPKKKVKKYLLFVLLALIVLGVISHFMWKSSGTGQWEEAFEGDGIKVWTKKVPGNPFLLAKGTTRIKSNLAGIMKFMRDPASCDDVGCYASRILDVKESNYPSLVYYTFRYDLFFPFKPREFVCKSEFTQDPNTKAMFVTFEIDATKMPPDPENCCVRPTYMYNTWRFTPVGNGEVEVEFNYDAGDMGGALPYALTNLGVVPLYQDTFNLLKINVAKEKYQVAKVDYVLEVGQDAPQPEAAPTAEAAAVPVEAGTAPADGT